ncbi:MAG TPA: glutathione S-transferase family protein [Polyangiales bacterium]
MSRQLYLTVRSPFARKVRILLLSKSLPFELKTIELAARTPEFYALSPLGKVPVLIDEDGSVVFDSTVIAEYLEDKYPSPPLFGTGVRERLLHRQLDELADTITDQAVALFYAKDTKDPAVLEKPNLLIDRALHALDLQRQRGELPQGFGLGQAALLCALDYVHFRLGKARTQKHPELVQWAASFAQRPSVLAAPPPTD